MKLIRIVLMLAGSLVGSVAFGAGFAHNANFIVYAPDQTTADEVLAKADIFRAEIAKEWLGEELPTGSGRTIISVSLSRDQDDAFTWPIDSPERKFHKMWLTTSREKAVGGVLRHEVFHTILNTRFPDRLPACVEEGIATLDDDPERMEARQRLIGDYARSGKWPDLRVILDAKTISSDDQAAYGVARSLMQYLLSRGDKATLLRFAATAKVKGWDAAVNEHYGIRSVRDLEQAWHAWASHASRNGGAEASPGS